MFEENNSVSTKFLAAERHRVLSPEEMKELVNLGLDISDASWAWVKFPNTEYMLMQNIVPWRPMMFISPEEIIPTYDLEDILEKLPDKIDLYPHDIMSKEAVLNLDAGQLPGERRIGYFSPYTNTYHDNYTSESYLKSAFLLLKEFVEVKDESIEIKTLK